MKIKLTQSVNGQSISPVKSVAAGGINPSKSITLPDFKKKYETVKALGCGSKTRDNFSSKSHNLGSASPER